MRANGVSARKDVPDRLRIGDGHFADGEERGFRAESMERLEDRLRDPRHRPVVEGQDNLFGPQQIIFFCMFGNGAIKRPVAAIDLNDAGNAKAVVGLAAASKRSRGGSNGNSQDHSAS